MTISQKKLWQWISMALVSSALIFTGCKKEFDEPPAYMEPDITANTTIAQLKAMHTLGQVEAITQDIIIMGIVNADDRSGNYYKQISIQDSTGGITVRLDGTNLYTNYPVGRKIWIKMNGLYLGDYNGLIQIGGSLDNSGSFPNVAALASGLFDQYIVKGSPNNTVTPVTLDLGSTNNNQYQSMLVQINGAEVAVADTAKTWANATQQLSANINIRNCDNKSIIVRTSGYANFAGVNVPNGNGTLLGIYTVFGTTPQLIIRDTSDAPLNGPRCGSGPVDPVSLMSIAEVRALYSGTTTTATAGKSITGVVISDRVGNNINGRNIVLQQGTGLAGIVVRFDANHSFNLGDSVTVNVGGQELSEFNGLLQVNNVPLTNATLVATGKTITPRSTTVSDINTNFEAWESTLVKVSGVTLTPAGTWSGSSTLTGGGSTIVHYTASGATFAGDSKPTGNIDLTGILGQGGSALTKQISIRNLNDVTGGGTTPSDYMTIEQLRQLFSGTTTTVPAGKYITGVVISDTVNSNITRRNMVIQQGTGLSGITVRFTANNQFLLGDSIRLNVGGLELSEFQGTLQLNNVPNANASLIASGKTITPRNTTVSEALTNFESWESTLVKFTGVTLSPAGAQWKDSVMVNQGASAIRHYGTSYSLFANNVIPTGSVSLTGILMQGGATAQKEVSIRRPSDVQ